jgi:hypothetical protein
VPLADGTPCDDGDPCTAGDVCVAAACRASAGSPAVRLAVQRFVLARARRGRRTLTARASFPALPGADPSRAGLGVTLRDASGAVVYRATVPADGFVRRRRRGVTRVTLRSPTPDGLRRVVFDDGGAVIDVRLRASAPGLDALAGARAAWLLQLGEHCVHDADLACRPAGGRVRCE